MRKLCVAATTATMLIVHSARSDEEMTPLAASGDWIAMAHRASAVSPPDVCMAASVSSQAAIRADGSTIEFRLVNQKWSLPANVSGQIVLSIGGKDTALDISGNSNAMVSAELTRDAAVELLNDMSKADLMRVKAGKDKPVVVSLAGSNRVLTAFRNCADLSGTSGGGENPF